RCKPSSGRALRRWTMPTWPTESPRCCGLATACRPRSSKNPSGRRFAETARQRRFAFCPGRGGLILLPAWCWTPFPKLKSLGGNSCLLSRALDTTNTWFAPEWKAASRPSTHKTFSAGNEGRCVLASAAGFGGQQECVQNPSGEGGFRHPGPTGQGMYLCYNHRFAQHSDRVNLSMRQEKYVFTIWITALAMGMVGCGGSSNSTPQPTTSGLTKRVLITNEQNSAVHLLDAQNDKFSRSIGTTSPTRIVTSGGQTVVLNSGLASISVIDNSKEAVASAGTLLNPAADVAVSTDGKTAYAAVRNSGVVEIFHSSDGTLVTTVSVPSVARLV